MEDSRYSTLVLQYFTRLAEIEAAAVSTNKARLLIHDLRALMLKYGRNESLSADSHGGGRYDRRARRACPHALFSPAHDTHRQNSLGSALDRAARATCG